MVASSKVSKIYEGVGPPSVDPEKVKQIAKSRSAKKSKNPYFWFRTEYFWVICAVCVIAAAIMTRKYLPQATPPHLKPITDSSFISKINARRSSFTVGPVRQFSTWTKDHVIATYGGIFATPHMDRMLPCDNPEGLPPKLPASFDSREKWADCFQQESYTTGNCSSSWAIAAATTMANRACIADPEGKSALDLSPQTMLSCDVSSLGCRGAGIDTMWIYVQERGLVKNTCFPWNATDGESCAKKCTDETPVKSVSRCKLPDENSIMREIMAHGPVVVVMILADDILLYKNGIYKPTDGTVHLVNAEQRPLTHVVKIIGWGTGSGTDYWLIQGSGFGGDWGDAGIMKLDRSAQKVVLLQTVVAPQVTYQSVNGLRSLEAEYEEAEWKAQEDERKTRLAEEARAKAEEEGNGPLSPDDAMSKISELLNTASKKKTGGSEDGDTDGDMEFVDEDHDNAHDHHDHQHDDDDDHHHHDPQNHEATEADDIQEGTEGGEVFDTDPGDIVEEAGDIAEDDGDIGDIMGDEFVAEPIKEEEQEAADAE